MDRDVIRSIIDAYELFLNSYDPNKRMKTEWLVFAVKSGDRVFNIGDTVFSRYKSNPVTITGFVVEGESMKVALDRSPFLIDISLLNKI